MKTTVKFLAGIVLVFSFIAVVNAGFWDWSKPYQGPSKDVSTLVITGNYTKARVLAELVQGETKQPIILLTSENGKIFFMPANGPCLEVQDAEFTNFIKFMHPKQIIILGDSRYVPESYTKRIDPTQTTIRVDNKDWYQVAVTVGKILDKTYLASNFKKLSDEIDSGKLYVTKKGPATSSGSPLPNPLDSVVTAEPVKEKKTVEPVLIKDTDVVPK
ncbi:MAG: hypothetical protein A2X45_24340 [Lentisphaerae bacterium GWF2_50_93]|nr:MAG: hypothetical protein A2X45_24340 [Lentisphaerae bacterium GWF2_50_93]